MARFLKWLLSLFVTTRTSGDTDDNGVDCCNWQQEVLIAQLRIDSRKCERSRQLLKRLDG